MAFQKLPIDQFEEQIVQTVRNNQVTVIAAETGAGKSTRVPLMLLRAGFGAKGLIGITETHRVAPPLLAMFDAVQHGTALGKIIGYQIGGERVFEQTAKVKFMTEGILIREMRKDRELRRYSVIIVDEAHDRGVIQDTIMALLHGLRKRRPDLKIVIMSATIDEGHFSDYFDNAPIIKVPGRMYPVKITYLSETPDGKKILDACVDDTEKIVRSGKPGDILIFLPEETGIRKVCDTLDDLNLGVRVLPFFRNQSPDEQKLISVRDGTRRVIVATNIAETSITIDGVVYVVDSGLIKSTQYVSASMSSLRVIDHSQAGCNQRAGRAGRTAPGECHRMYSEADFRERPAYTEPEIRRMALDQFLLHLRVLGYTTDEVLALKFMDPPGNERWLEAEARLKILGALNAKGEVTHDGEVMERLPVAPMLGRMILTADKFGCTEEIATIVTGLTSRPAFVRPRGMEAQADAAHASFKDATSDALTLLNVWDGWYAAGENGERLAWARDHFISSRAMRDIERNSDLTLDILEAEGFKVTSNTDPLVVRKAVAAGAIVNLCINEGGKSYRWCDRSDIYIYPSSGLFKTLPQMLVCASIVESSRAFARDCTAIDPAWLEELIPADAREYRIAVQRSFLGDHITLVAQMYYQGNMIKEKSITALTPELVALLAVNIAQEVIGYLNRPLHPQTASIREVFEQIVLIRGAHMYNLTTEHELFKKLTLHIATRIADATTLAEMCGRDISLLLTDWLTPAELTRYEAGIIARATETELRQAAEARRIKTETEEQLAREKVANGFRSRLNGLKARAQGLTGRDATTLRARMSEIDYHISWHRPEEVESELAGCELKIRRLEEEQVDRIKMSNQVWEAILAKFPTCPLCGGKWQESGGLLLVCTLKHNPNQLLAIDPATPNSNIGRFVTNRDDLAAEVIYDDTVLIRFTGSRKYAWAGKSLKTVRYEAQSVILPDSLIAERAQIIRDIDELRSVRDESDELARKVRARDESAGAKPLRKITFRTIGGVSAAKVGAFYYQAVFESDPYPQASETWYCEVVRETHNGGRACLDVRPVIKADIAESDVETLCALLRETYPGLPEELLS